MAEKKTKKNKETKTDEVKSKYSGILLRPRVTEKASLLQVENIYVFEIAPNAGKREIIKAIKDIHKVSPIKINIVRNPAKKIFLRGKANYKGGVKKAYIHLKAGDKIK